MTCIMYKGWGKPVCRGWQTNPVYVRVPSHTMVAQYPYCAHNVMYLSTLFRGVCQMMWFT